MTDVRWGHPDQWQGRDSAEREQRLRDALNRIAGLTHQDIDGAPTWALISEIHRTARNAIDPPASPRTQHDRKETR